MPLSWDEIKDRALRFSREWADESAAGAEYTIESPSQLRFTTARMEAKPA